MNRTGKAYFVEGVRTGDELRHPQPLERERRYEIVKTVMLSKIDYENFSTDMLVSRAYLEDPEGLSGQGETWRCFYIQQRGRVDGVLVIPDKDGFVKWAAYLPE